MVQFENADDAVIEAAYQYVTEGSERKGFTFDPEGKAITIRWGDSSDIDRGASELRSGGDSESRMTKASEEQIKRIAEKKGLTGE